MVASVLKTFVLVLLVAVLTAVPAAARPPLCLNCHPSHHGDRGGCRTCHGGNPDAGRKEIAHHRLIAGRYARHTLGNVPEVKSGRESLERYACRRCHVIGGRGNALSVSLDVSARRLMPQQLASAMSHPAAAMPDFRLTDVQITDLVNALVAESNASARSGTHVGMPRVVHFEGPGRERGDPFSRQCGGCHRALTQRLGAVGTGTVGPNLSGVFSPHYPPTYIGAVSWTPRRLEEWLANPRRVRPAAAMRPLKITPEELEEIERTLSVDR